MTWDTMEVVLALLLAGNFLLLCRKFRPGKPPQELEEQILAMVEEGEEQGDIQSMEKELIEKVFDFQDCSAQDVMIHRRDITMIWIEDSQEKIQDLISSTGLSRFPVYGQNPDDVLGILTARRYLLSALSQENLPLEELIRPAHFVPETLSAHQLLRDMQWQKNHLALVVDEYGGVSGLVTLEDLLEEIVGNIYDEFDPQAQVEIQQIQEDLWRVTGTVDLEEVAEAMDHPLPEDLEFDTIGGLVYHHLDTIPQDGSCPSVEALGLRVTVESIQNQRITWATVAKLAPAPEEDQKPGKNRSGPTKPE